MIDNPFPCVFAHGLWKTFEFPSLVSSNFAQNIASYILVNKWEWRPIGSGLRGNEESEEAVIEARSDSLEWPVWMGRTANRGQIKSEQRLQQSYLENDTSHTTIKTKKEANLRAVPSLWPIQLYSLVWLNLLDLRLLSSSQKFSE